MKKKHNPQLPLVQALGWIVGSTLLISGSAFAVMKHYLRQQWHKQFDASQRVTAIVQTGPQKEALKTLYLAELIGVSIDKPVQLIDFDCEKAREKLLASPVIREASVKKLPPNTLYIDYSVRQPVAWVYEYENTAIDAEGYLFPVYPFFSPKNLPEIYLGLPSFGTFPILGWQTPLKGKQIDLAFSLLKLLQESEAEELLHVKRIDVSNAFAESYGIREIVLICEDQIGEESHRRFLRLSTKNYPQELGNYLKLRQELLAAERGSPSSEKVIDLRIQQLAFIEAHEQKK